MNNKWSNLILNRMIDKYERTTAYVNGEVPKNRIILNFYGKNKSDFSEYDIEEYNICLLYTSPSPRDKRQSRMPSSA